MESKYRKDDKMDKKDFTRKTVVFLSWDKLSEVCSQTLSSLLNRNILAYATSDELHMRAWNILLGTESSLSNSEVKVVLNAADADDYEWDANDFGEYPAKELTASVIVKLLNKTLRLNMGDSYPEEDGVWFFEREASPAKYRILIEFPETDCRPDLLEFITSEKEDEVKRIVENGMMSLRHLRKQEDEIDRLEFFDLYVKTLEEKLHTNITTLKIDRVENI